MTTMDGHYAKLKGELDAMVKEQTDESAQAVAAGRAQAERNSTLILVGFGIALAATVFLSWLIYNMIVPALTLASRVATSVAQGDLSQRPQATSTDATGQVIEALGTVTQNLSRVVVDIRSTAELINNAASEISLGNADLSRRTETQACQPGRDGRIDAGAELGREEQRGNRRGRPTGWPARPVPLLRLAVPWWGRWSAPWKKSRRRHARFPTSSA
ncbi:MAG: methyl-accepting chemotaxis protein [Acidovorax sp.]|nr:methyl-accepting chemotaxis protein [Acidovorax sp.]